MNPRLYSYAAEFPDFFPDRDGRLKKEIVLKVSDFHSAAVQGKFLAKARAVGLRIPGRIRFELWRPCVRHQGIAAGANPAGVSTEAGELVAQLHAVYAKALAAQPGGRHDPVGRSHYGTRRHRDRRRGSAAEGLLRSRRHRLGDAVPVGARGHQCRRRAPAEVVRGEQRRRLPQRQFAFRSAVLESAHLGERRGAPAASPRTGREVLARQASPSCSTPNSPGPHLHGIAGIPKIQAGAA